MKRALGAALAALTLGAGGLAHADPVDLAKASPPNSYFNRPGADLATHDAELRDCMVMAARTRQPNHYAYSPSLLGAVITAAVVAGLDSVENDHALRANAESCMVVRGWRVVEVDKDQADAIAKLPQPQQAEKLRDWVGSADPPGQVIRQWNNDGASGATTKFQQGRLLGGAPSLSFTARDHGQDGKLPAVASRSVWTQYAGLAKELKAGALASAPKEDAIVVVFIKGSGLHAGDTLTFRRMGSDPVVSPREADKLPDLFIAYDNWVWHKGGQWYAYAVPPGRWRVGAMTEVGNNLELNFCLGSPAFEMKAGDVVYAGAFDLSQDYIGPDLALEPAKAWLGASGFAAALKPAAYVNGTRGDCGGTYIYNLEFKGTPYTDGYGWGGAVRAASPPIPAPALAPAGSTTASADQPAALVPPAPVPPAAPTPQRNRD